MTEPRITDPAPAGLGVDVTVSDGEHTHRVWVPLSADRGMREMAIEKWRAEVERKKKAAQCQPGCSKGTGP